MVKQGEGGSIILIGSISAHVINRPDAQPGMTHYCVSKGAIVHMAKALGVEWAEYGIRVNSLSPGNIVTPIAPSDEKTVAYFRHATPLARMGTPNEIGRPAVYLASDASSFQSCTDVLIGKSRLFTLSMANSFFIHKMVVFVHGKNYKNELLPEPKRFPNSPTFFIISFFCRLSMGREAFKKSFSRSKGRLVTSSCSFLFLPPISRWISIKDLARSVFYMTCQ